MEAGQIAHTFEGCSQTQRGDDHTQVGGHRALLGQQLHALVDDAGFEGVDLDVSVDDRLGRLEILVDQRVSGAVDRLADVLHHAVEVIGDSLELFVENNAHMLAFQMLYVCWYQVRV